MSSPVSVEWEEDDSANCVQEDEVEDDDVKDTKGRFLIWQGALKELLALLKDSDGPTVW